MSEKEYLNQSLSLQAANNRLILELHEKMNSFTATVSTNTEKIMQAEKDISVIQKENMECNNDRLAATTTIKTLKQIVYGIIALVAFLETLNHFIVK
jgi:cbb3-type cytochrome oxidase cytochrome c subunit